MKTYKMMEMLIENPKLEAVSKNSTEPDDVVINSKGALVWKNKLNRARRELGFNKNFLFECCSVDLNAEWEIVYPSVTWQEAIQAWISGKIVYYYFNNTKQYLNMSKFYLEPELDSSSLRRGLSKHELTEGKWYIEL